eukprot:g2330.t1
MNFFGSRKSKKSASSSSSASSGGAGGGGGGGGSVEAVQKLKRHVETFDKKIALLDSKIEKQMREAQRYAKTGNKRAAMNALKRKKMYEKQRQNQLNQKFNMEQMQDSLEQAAFNREAFRATQETRNAMQQMKNEINVDVVADTTDDLQELMADAEDIQNMLSESIGGDQIDEDDLMAELDDLEQELTEEEMLDMGTKTPAATVGPTAGKSDRVDLPQAPTGTLEVQDADADEDEEAALAALEATMA